MQQNTNQYRLSLYGRVGYSVMAILFLMLSVFALAPFIKPGHMPIWQVALVTVFGFLSVSQFVYSLSQLLRRKPRFVVTPETITYYGLYGRRIIPWDQIQDCSLDFTGKNPMVFLKLRLKNRKWLKGWTRFDASGMSPNYENLNRVVQKYVKHAQQRVSE